MKRFSLPVCLCLALVACDDGTKPPEDPAKTSTASAGTVPATKAATPDPDAVKPPPPQVHTARTSLDYVGRYQAKGGIQDDPFAVQINKDGTFRLLPRNGPSIAGLWRWDETGFIITLEDGGKPVARFFVAENSLRKLDKGPSEGLVLNKVLSAAPPGRD